MTLGALGVVYYAATNLDGMNLYIALGAAIIGLTIVSDLKSDPRLIFKKK